MPGAYVPPHRRTQTQDASSPSTTWPAPKNAVNQEAVFTLQAIHDHFWPSNGLNRPSHDSGLSTEGVLNKTLHNTKERPGKLTFVLLFAGANPKWESEHVIFTKSSLGLLPGVEGGNASKEGAQQKQKQQQQVEVDGGEADKRQATGDKVTDADESEVEPPAGHERDEAEQPVAVFKQLSSKKGKAKYAFDGWYRVASVDLLEPASLELISLLDKKWTTTEGWLTVQEKRSDHYWKKSLKLRWAVVKFERDTVADKEAGVPEVEREVELPAKEEESVNEMLAEMRLKDSTDQ